MRHFLAYLRNAWTYFYETCHSYSLPSLPNTYDILKLMGLDIKVAHDFPERHSARWFTVHWKKFYSYCLYYFSDKYLSCMQILGIILFAAQPEGLWAWPVPTRLDSIISRPGPTRHVPRATQPVFAQAAANCWPWTTQWTCPLTVFEAQGQYWIEYL